MYTILNITCKPNQDTTDQVVYTYVTCRLTCIHTAMGIYIHHVQAYLHLHRRASYQDLPVHMHPRMRLCVTPPCMKQIDHTSSYVDQHR